MGSDGGRRLGFGDDEGDRDRRLDSDGGDRRLDSDDGDRRSDFDGVGDRDRRLDDGGGGGCIADIIVFLI